MKRKYQSWGDFLKKRREMRFRSAREFCSRVTVGISYPQYSRYEAGDQLPNLEQALELCRFLDIPTLEGLLEWNRAQIHEGEILKEVEQLIVQVRAKNAQAEQTANSNKKSAESAESEAEQKAQLFGGLNLASVSLDDVIVFNRSHLKLFSSDPTYRDIFTYINSYAPEWVSSEEIGVSLELKPSQLEEMLEKLSDLGVILMAGGRCRASKRNFYFPDDADFFQLRNLNLIHNATSIMRKLQHDQLANRRAYRGLLSRELTEEQLENVIRKADDLMGDVVGLPETTNPEKIYSFCVLIGERFSRPNPNQIDDLRRLNRTVRSASAQE